MRIFNMKNLFDFFGFDANVLTAFENELYDEIKSYLEYKREQTAEKEVSHPCNDKKTCKCNKTYSENNVYPCSCENNGECICDESMSGELQVVSDVFEDGGVYTNDYVGEEDAYPSEPVTVTVDGWLCSQGENGMPIWTRDVCVPVEKQFANVSILDNEKVYIEYDKVLNSTEDDLVCGYHHVSGCYSFNLPTFADARTFKAKFVKEGTLRLTVSEVPCREGSCQTINIEG